MTSVFLSKPLLLSRSPSSLHSYRFACRSSCQNAAARFKPVRLRPLQAGTWSNYRSLRLSPRANFVAQLNTQVTRAAPSQRIIRYAFMGRLSRLGRWRTHVSCYGSPVWLYKARTVPLSRYVSVISFVYHASHLLLVNDTHAFQDALFSWPRYLPSPPPSPAQILRVKHAFCTWLLDTPCFSIVLLGVLTLAWSSYGRTPGAGSCVVVEPDQPNVLSPIPKARPPLPFLSELSESPPSSILSFS